MLTTKKRFVSNALPGPIDPVPPAQTAAGASVELLGAKAVPRALRHGGRSKSRGVCVAAQRVADQDDVVTRGREAAISLISNVNRV